jgi:hypothetical protein
MPCVYLPGPAPAVTVANSNYPLFITIFYYHSSLASPPSSGQMFHIMSMEGVVSHPPQPSSEKLASYILVFTFLT